MPTQYVMKATHINSAPLGQVQWVVTGAPDNTGTLSGYNPVDLTNIAVDYTTTVSASTSGSGGTSVLVPTRLTPTDSSTLINWTLNETVGSYLNSGVGSALSLTTFTGTPRSITGLFSEALVVNGSTILSTGNSSVNEPTGSAVTVSAWVRMRSYSVQSTIVNKAYRSNNTWTTPYVSLYMYVGSAGVFGTEVSTAGGTVLASPASANPYLVPLGIWTHLSFTYDGSNLRSYINGHLWDTTAGSGALDFGTHGPWDVGGTSNAGSGGTYFDGDIDDVRVENVVRSQSYLELMYKNGLGLYENTFGNPVLSILSDGYANLPPAGLAGRIFMPTDGMSVLRDNGTTWKAFGPVQPIILPPTGVSGWTWVNQQSATVTNASTGIQLVCPGTGSPVTGGLVTTGIGTTSVQSGAVWTSTFDSFSTNAFSASWGVMMFETGTNKYAAMRVMFHQNVSANFASTFQAVFSYGVNTTETAATSRFGAFSPHSPTYARLRISGGNVIGEITQDLQQPTWAQMGSIATTTAFTSAPTHVGITFDPPGISGKTTYITFFHFTSS